LQQYQEIGCEVSSQTVLARGIAQGRWLFRQHIQHHCFGGRIPLAKNDAHFLFEALAQLSTKRLIDHGYAGGSFLIAPFLQADGLTELDDAMELLDLPFEVLLPRSGIQIRGAEDLPHALDRIGGRILTSHPVQPKG
jgi:hypothetical protein